RPFVSACDEFKFVDKLSKEVKKAADKPISLPKAAQTQENIEKAPKVKAPRVKKVEETSQTDLTTITNTVIDLINDNSDEDGYMLVSDIGIILSKRYADFDSRNFGFKKLVPFLESLAQFEIKKVTDLDNKKVPNAQIAYIKIK
ncbi:MAG: OST-HTH/LOTUS domain-containing protein, partial [Oscillospiraceae bacterium]